MARSLGTSDCLPLATAYHLRLTAHDGRLYTGEDDISGLAPQPELGWGTFEAAASPAALAQGAQEQLDQSTGQSPGVEFTEEARAHSVETIELAAQGRCPSRRGLIGREE